MVTLLGVSLQKNNIKVSEGTANAVGCLVDFQLIWLYLYKIMILSRLWRFQRRTEEGSKMDRRREVKLTIDRR